MWSGERRAVGAKCVGRGTVLGQCAGSRALTPELSASAMANSWLIACSDMCFALRHAVNSLFDSEPEPSCVTHVTSVTSVTADTHVTCVTYVTHVMDVMATLRKRAGASQRVRGTRRWAASVSDVQCAVRGARGARGAKHAAYLVRAMEEFHRRLGADESGRRLEPA